MSDELLPLFPLDVVLFPGMPLPLHIFEPRYKQMTRHCLDHRQEFGVLLARGEKIAEVGCSAEIVKVIKQYEDGRMDILTMGESRFRVLEVFEDLPYLQGRVDYLAEDEEAKGTPASTRLLESYEEISHLLFRRTPEPPRGGGGVSLAFQIASQLPLPHEYKQQVLELRSEAARQQSLAEQLHRWLPQLKRLKQVKAKSGGNGNFGLG
ncbi:MAG: LON peptidase substrate-binding domain-containing protein [Acidobacteria bacterium]|nr:LON peptidase substrate-binding domain-containing protein [Acidobacteriota bacterium]